MLKFNFFFVLMSFTKINGNRDNNEIKPAIKIIFLKLRFKYQINNKTENDPKTAPNVSNALCIPKPSPLCFFIDSEIMTSLGESRIPLPILSKEVKISIWVHNVDNDSRIFDIDEVKYPETTKTFLLFCLSDK